MFYVDLGMMEQALEKLLNRAVTGKRFCRIHGIFAFPKTTKGGLIEEVNTTHSGDALKRRKTKQEINT